MTTPKIAEELAIGRLGSRRILQAGAAALALAVFLTCGTATPARAGPNESRRVHVEGQLIPVETSPGVYRISGGLLGTYKGRTERAINAWTYFGTQISETAGTESINGCVDQNQNESCDAGEPSGDLRLIFSRVASFDTETGRLIESRSTHNVITAGRFSGGMATRDIPVGSSNEVVSTYEGELQVMDVNVD
jgi:hypothetical protein